MTSYLDGASLPAAEITLQDTRGEAPDLDGYTLTVRIGPTGGTALLEKTTGLAYTAGVLTVDWAAGELPAPGAYEILVIAAAGDGRERRWNGPLRIGRTLAPATP